MICQRPCAWPPAGEMAASGGGRALFLHARHGVQQLADAHRLAQHAGHAQALQAFGVQLAAAACQHHHPRIARRGKPALPELAEQFQGLLGVIGLDDREPASSNPTATVSRTRISSSTKSTKGDMVEQLAGLAEVPPFAISSQAVRTDGPTDSHAARFRPPRSGPGRGAPWR